MILKDKTKVKKSDAKREKSRTSVFSLLVAGSSTTREQFAAAASAAIPQADFVACS